MSIIVNSLAKSYGELQVLDDFNISFPPTQINCLFGPSGCGKTTLLNILAGLVSADGGQIEGTEAKKFSYIFQEDRLLPWATVEENLLFVLESYLGKAQAYEQIKKYLAIVNLTQYGGYYPDQLSGGMKQRVAIARAFAYAGDILVMDEPFKGLDFELKKGLMDYIIQFWRQEQKDKYFIFVTHDVEEALYLSDQIFIFKGPPLSIRDTVTIDIPQGQRSNGSQTISQLKDKLLSSPA